MKFRLIALLLGILLASACTSLPATDQVENEPASETATSNVEKPDSTETFTAPLPPTASPTPTVVPVENRWYWTYDPATTGIIAVSLAGETQSIGELDLEEAVNYLATPVDDEAGLLLVAALDGLRAYRLTPTSMERIPFPSSYPWDGAISPSSLAVVGTYNRNVLVTYATRESWQGDVTSMPRTGPAFFVDGTSLTATLVDSHALYDSFTDPRLWFHSSADKRFLRYLDGDPADMRVREIDLQTGENRTIANTTKSPTRIYSSPDGGLWFLRNSDLILDVSGNQTAFTDTTHRFYPLDEGRGIIAPVECSAPCTLQVVSPMESSEVLTYSLPWGTTGGAHFPLLSQLLPDDSLLYAAGYDRLVKNPASVLVAFPTLLEDDNPVFRLSPDGSTKLVGAYRSIEFPSSGFIPVSTDGRYLLLKAVDQSHLFIYDAHTDMEVISLPIDPALDYFYTSVLYAKEGILLHATASTPDKQYRDFYSLYLFTGEQTTTWEDSAGEFYGCSDIYPDGSLACWVYEEGNANLVRYQPGNGERTSLIDRVWMLEYLP